MKYLGSLRGDNTRAPRLLELPGHGRLLVCTDLHGNLRDFQRMRELFLEAWNQGEQPFLLFTGDLIHGPSCQPEEWPDYLGSYFVDASEQVVEGFIALQQRFPGQVACLLGNHEHSHVGGPHTPKFWPDETEHFEEVVGPERTERYRALFRSLPAVAVSQCGLVVTHAAPNAVIDSPRDIEQLCYENSLDMALTSEEQLPLLGRLLWSRSCRPEVARRFLDALTQGGSPLCVVVYGHEIVAEGFERIGHEQLLLSTSFGVSDDSKTYLSAELDGRYGSSYELRQGIELRRLYA